ncbi:MAG: ArnT family glycosyltransferase [Acidobacteriota bacterium]
MQLVRRYRLPALFCALAVLLCDLVSRPYANMGICDDGPYILMAQHLARTGHIAYNGWSAAMMGWQLYLGAAFIRLFGFSFTAVRMSTLLVALLTAWLLQRTLVLAGVNERNAVLGTLAFVLSPLYLMLSVTYMSDIDGLLAVVACLYGCLRALQARKDRAAIFWLGFAVATNAVFGTARQIAWLGILVMLPSALYLLRKRWRVLPAGAAVTLAGALSIFACMQWFSRQPYIQPEHLIPNDFPVLKMLAELGSTFLEMPFLLLPVAAIFLPQMRRCGPRVRWASLALLLGYLWIARHPRPLNHVSFLEPTNGDWVSIFGIHSLLGLQGDTPVYLHPAMRMVLTAVSFGGLFGVVATGFCRHSDRADAGPEPPVSWRQLGVLLTPFVLVYWLLLIPRSTIWLFDRYLLPLLVVALLCLVRLYQERVRGRIPLPGALLVAGMAIYAVAVTGNMFSFYRARTVLAAELRARDIPDTSVDNGWEYNFNVEIQQADHLNDKRVVIPADAYLPVPKPPAGSCAMYLYDETPHIHPLYGVSFDPGACYGPAPFAPVHFSRWPYRTPGTLYVVRYVPAAELPPGMP